MNPILIFLLFWIICNILFYLSFKKINSLIKITLDFPEPKYFLVLLNVIIILSLFAGLQGNIFIEPEFLNGILIGTSILFGFIIMLLEKIPKNYKNDIFGISLLSIGFLSISIILIYFSALEKVPTSLALNFLAVSFITNLFFLLWILWKLF